MIFPNNFRVNEAWIVIRINDAFIFVKNQPYDIYVLMDAASTYIFGNVISRVVDEDPDQKDVEDLFRTAWAAKNQWAEKLILTKSTLAENVFRTEAEKNGLSIEIVSLSDLGPIVDPLKESFASFFT